ncbi:hypothetical protein [Histidinibacterium lentulum]|uniref:hypothetical protein n=1 Tax=Histidinibacterium lentulum TaxID=2480588 RepID=UPI001613A23E|nr:hypothetical protein [Histidinibacterium lentulum]
MTDASWTDVPRIARAPEASVPLPAPVPFAAPVLIGDVTTPLAGETLLSLLWKRLDDRP